MKRNSAQGTAKNRVELFEGPVSGFEIRPVLARWYGMVRNG